MRFLVAGVSLPVVFAVLVIFASRLEGDVAPERPATRQVTDPGPVTSPQSASIDFVRGVAKRDLTSEGARLASCGRPKLRCAHLPLAHIGFGGRAAGGKPSAPGAGPPRRAG